MMTQRAHQVKIQGRLLNLGILGSLRKHEIIIDYI